MNYNNELLKLINDLEKRPTLLLHSCCGPCSSYVISFLVEHFDITIFYYNPCIEPSEEYILRKEEQIKFINNFKSDSKVNFLDCAYDNEIYRNLVKGYELLKEGGARCSVCFNQRLEKTSLVASELGFDYFGTTLTVSPHKNAELINKIGRLCEKTSLFLPSDFKKNDGYKKSIELSYEYDLYRQDYCGCLFSKNDQ